MILISPSPTADTRTCDVLTVSKDTLETASRQHIMDVMQGLMFFSKMLERASIQHDYDKLTDIETFYRDFQTGFKVTEWWDRHRKLNRHHLMHEDGIPHDVNLIDVLDYITDCTMAGMARSGFVYDLSIPDSLLQLAFKNTCALLKQEVQLVKEEQIEINKIEVPA